MNRRRLLVLFALIALGSIIALGWWVVFSSRASATINPDNFARIQVGMPLEEVEAILGGPARSERCRSLAANPAGRCRGRGHRRRAAFFHRL